jgi:hypothetical protein
MRFVRRDTLRTEVRNMRDAHAQGVVEGAARLGQVRHQSRMPAAPADIEFLAQYWALLHAGYASAGR